MDLAKKKGIDGRSLVAALQKKLAPKVRGGFRVREAIAERIGYSTQAIYNWQQAGRNVGAAELARLIATASQTAQKQTIKPIIEFFAIAPINEVRRDKNKGPRKLKRYKLFDASGAYEDGVKSELEQKFGVYIFYDSRGRALYVGKAADQTLWREMTEALNRDRDVQKIWRVKHPVRRVRFRTVDEKRRQIRSVKAKLYELASFVSAYEVPSHIIGVFEAVLVRSFANDLLNVKMENFTPRTKRKTKRRRRTG